MFLYLAPLWGAGGFSLRPWLLFRGKQKMPKSAQPAQNLPPSLRGAKRRGNPFSLGLCMVIVRREGMRIPTSGVALLGMTGGGWRRVAPIFTAYSCKTPSALRATSPRRGSALRGGGTRSLTPAAPCGARDLGTGDADSHDQFENWFATAALPPSPFRENDSLVRSYAPV